jgi:hypothetical protein
MTRISVIVPSYRIGGIDVLCDSLACQSFADFELIVTDAIHARRRSVVAEHAKCHPFPIKHIAPGGGPELSNYCRSINDAIVHAAGELVVIQTDYTWMPPDCLETHWNAYAASDKRTCFVLDNHCTALPPLHPEFHGYGPDMELCYESNAEVEAQINAGADAYAADLAAGKLDRFMWSIFAEPPTNETAMALRVTRSDVKQGRPEIDYRHCSLKNESIPTEAFLAVNGLDERFDGSHLYQDQEFALRVERAGFRWSTTPGGAALIVNPRTRLSSKRLGRPMASNGALMDELLAGRLGPANPGRRLRQERELCLAGRAA